MTGRADPGTPAQGTSGRRYAVLGHPVAHSLSPPMQNAAFRAAGIDARYEAIDVPPERLGRTLDRLHAEGVAGLNVTLPLKEAAWSLATTRTEEAERARAANTLRREDEGWAAHATDGLGFADWIRDLGLVLVGRRVLLLGAGGAATSVAPFVLEERPAALAIASRTEAHARALAERLGRSHGDVPVAAGPLERASGEADVAAAGPFDLAVRALSAQDVSEGEARLWRALLPRAPVLDLNYGARASRVEARARGEDRPFEDGLGLLLRQGALSFTFWTGREAPIEAMRQALLAAAAPR